MRDDTTVNIVILDDMIENLIILVKVVNELGYVARPVNTIRQAMEAIRICEPKLLLLDIAMPEMSGFDFYKRVRTYYREMDLPVIFVSAYMDPQTKKEAYDLGAADYVTRPFVESELACRIRQQVQVAMEREKREKELSDLKQMLGYRMNLRNQNKLSVIQSLYYIQKQQELIRGHMDRVAEGAVMLAKALMFMPKYEKIVTDHYIDCLKVVAPIFDLGMMAISQSIVYKPGELSKEEFQEIKQHTEKGVEPLLLLYRQDEENEYLKMALDMAMYHHEAYDGSGYPYGLRKDQIPLCAQIISIVSVFDALTHKTIYREAWSIQNGFAFLREQKDKRFAGDLLHAFEITYLADFLDKEIKEGV
ncbi:MAG: response regulator [bacterium]|nr:response regulator [bacterium]